MTGQWILKYLQKGVVYIVYTLHTFEDMQEKGCRTEHTHYNKEGMKEGIQVEQSWRMTTDIIS